LSNAPITEALVDFRVILPAAFEPNQFRQVDERLRADFPQLEERKSAEATVKFAEGRPATQMRDLGLTGVWIKSPDGKSIGQFRTDGFTFNRLKPYTSWEEILPTALRLWDEYARLASPEVVTRVALRYINHLTLPSASGDLDQLITTAPRLPQDIPQFLSGFLTRVVLQDYERGLSANFTQALEVGVQTQSPTLLLDIDTYRLGQFPPQREVLERHLGELRSYKNAIFFGSLTDDFIRRFE
jgi:uncharacterized protein (TIGR04255 family)